MTTGSCDFRNQHVPRATLTLACATFFSGDPAIGPEFSAVAIIQIVKDVFQWCPYFQVKHAIARKTRMKLVILCGFQLHPFLEFNQLLQGVGRVPIKAKPDIAGFVQIAFRADLGAFRG